MLSVSSESRSSAVATDVATSCQSVDGSTLDSARAKESIALLNAFKPGIQAVIERGKPRNIGTAEQIRVLPTKLLPPLARASGQQQPNCGVSVAFRKETRQRPMTGSAQIVR
jgi:hypothetical protein